MLCWALPEEDIPLQGAATSNGPIIAGTISKATSRRSRRWCRSCTTSFGGCRFPSPSTTPGVDLSSPTEAVR